MRLYDLQVSVRFPSSLSQVQSFMASLTDKEIQTSYGAAKKYRI